MLVKEIAFLIIILIIAMLMAKLLVSYLKIIIKNSSHEIKNRVIRSLFEPIYLFFLVLAITISNSAYNIYIPYFQSFVFVLVVFFLTILTYRMLRIFINNLIVHQNNLTKAPHLVRGLIYIIIYLIGFILILNHFQIEITPFIATLGIGGLAVGLALQGTLGNFFAGLNLMSDGSINVGDYIEFEKYSGWVEDIGTVYTKIRTITNSLVVISNANFASKTITNDSRPHVETGFRVSCGVAYGSDLVKVEKIAFEVAKSIQEEIPGAVKGFDPIVRFYEFGESNINFNTILRLERLVDKFKIRHEFIKRLKTKFDKEGIEISWPVRKIVN